MAASVRLPRPEEPALAARRRLGRRLAAGMRPAAAARAEGVAPGTVEALLAEPGFQGLVAAYRELHARPRADQLARLEILALGVIEEALVEGDMRVALFFMAERRRGRDPARTLAEAVIAAGARGHRPAPPPAGTRRRQHRPADPLAGFLGRGRLALRDRLAAEHAACAAATRPSRRPALPRVPAPPAASTGDRPHPDQPPPGPASPPRPRWPCGP